MPVFDADDEVIAAIELAGADPDLTSVVPMLWMASRSLTREVAGAFDQSTGRRTQSSHTITAS